MVKEFYECLRARIYASRKLGRRKNDLVVWYQRGHDLLFVYRNAPNNYTIKFDSHVPENKWVHQNVILREAIRAVASFDKGRDMLGLPFHNTIMGIFKY